VGAYGIDQAYLRAEGLVPQYNPSAVILSFISDDINRTELAYYRYGRGWKPYFEHDSAGALVLRNVPVPREPLPGVLDGWPALRRLLGRSVLADALLDRVVEPGDGRVHRHGEAVSAALFQKLDQLCRRWQSRLIVVALATNGHIGGNERLSRVVARAREGGIEVLDLATAMQRFDAGQFQQMFRADGHYAPSLNRWVAEQLATTLR
jgi:hypothetical protein